MATTMFSVESGPGASRTSDEVFWENFWTETQYDFWSQIGKIFAKLWCPRCPGLAVLGHSRHFQSCTLWATKTNNAVLREIRCLQWELDLWGNESRDLHTDVSPCCRCFSTFSVCPRPSLRCVWYQQGGSNPHV